MPLRRLGFLLPLTLPVLIVAGFRLGGAWNFLTVAWTFALVPLVDWLGGLDTAPTALRRGEEPGWDRFFDALLMLWVPVQLALQVIGALKIASIDGFLDRAGFALSIGAATGGIGIIVAHELGHRRGRAERLLAGVLLTSVAYLHFYIEHNQGHHSHVGTDADPASARPGEAFWRFLPRTLRDGFASAWRIETTRLRAAQQSPHGLGNRMLWAVGGPLLILVLLAIGVGAPAVAFFVTQAFTAIVLLELVNYIEHYGLQRRRGADGRFERVGVEHSWNSSRRFSNWLTYNLQRHSHHHVQVTRHYQELEHAAAAPQLPTGYAGMIVLALVPPLWRAIMDARLAAWQRQRELAA